MRVLLVFSLLLLPAFVLSRQEQSPNVVPTDPLVPAEEARQFRLPPGFEAQLVAAEPDIHKPMNIAFDDQGRLWVTDTLEYPFPAKPGTKPRDTVKVLEDFAPDGRARKITTFVDGLNIPIGLLPLPGNSPRSALVFGIPEILHVQDSTGNGVADRRKSFYSTYGTRDTHGMTNAFLHHFDGWVYACHGFSNQSNIKGSDGQAIQLQSGNTYRMKTDGSHLEQYTWGQVNPFGLGVDRWGHLYTSDCHSEPIYALLREGYYPSFGKPDDGLGFAPRMYSNYKGSTAVAGLTIYSATEFPREYQGSAFVGDVMTNQLVRFAIEWKGASPVATAHVFMDSKDRWFRPVDVKLGPDGALYVADFYNRIIGHYEVPLTHPGRDRHRGRIWRIAYKGTPMPGVRADRTRATTDQLIDDLAQPNLTSSLAALHQLVLRGPDSFEKPLRERLLKSTSDSLHASALWALDRVGKLDDDTLGREARGPSELARVHARRVLGERPRLTAQQRDLLLEGLGDVSPQVQRVAAEALGRHPDPANVQPLLVLRPRIPASDTHLTHVLRIALRAQLRLPATWKQLTGLIGEDERAVADVALGVASPQAADWLVRHIAGESYPTEQLARFVQHIARNSTSTDHLLTFCQAHQKNQLAHQAALVRALARGVQERGEPLSNQGRAWASGLTGTLLQSAHEGEVRLGIELCGQVRLDEQQAKLVALVTTPARSPGVVLAGLQALVQIDAGRHAATLSRLLNDAGQPIELREQTAGLLGQANQPATRKLLVEALATAPARLQTAIASSLAGSKEGALQMLDTVTAGKASARLLTERGVVTRLEAARLAGLKERLEKLTAGLPAADVKLASLIGSRRKGFLASKSESERGKLVFEKHCAICHQLGGKGAKVGPQLDGVGLRGLDRLLEDTLDPNRNIDQAFRTTVLTLKKGQIVQGLLLREEGAVLVLADAQGKEVRISKSEVEERALSPVSPMPANLYEQIPEADFHHLLAYLLAQKPAAR